MKPILRRILAIAGYDKGMATYTITRGGAMVEASVSGQKCTFIKLEK